MSEEQNNRPETEQELSEILQIRRDKLAALQQAGRDPFPSPGLTSRTTAPSHDAGFERGRKTVSSPAA